MRKPRHGGASLDLEQSRAQGVEGRGNKDGDKRDDRTMVPGILGAAPDDSTMRGREVV
jgi:hypothetical protein